MRHLAAAHQHNVELMKQGFGINDAHTVVLQMISHDIVTGVVRMKPMVHDEIDFHAERREKGLPDKDYYDDLKEHGSSPYRVKGQTLDLEWYHQQYNTVSRFLAFILWMRESTGIMKDQNA